MVKISKTFRYSILGKASALTRGISGNIPEAGGMRPFTGVDTDD